MMSSTAQPPRCRRRRGDTRRRRRRAAVVALTCHPLLLGYLLWLLAGECPCSVSARLGGGTGGAIDLAEETDADETLMEEPMMEEESSIPDVDSAACKSNGESSSSSNPHCRRWLLDVPVIKKPVRELFAQHADDQVVDAMVGYKTTKGLRLVKSLVKHITDEDILVEVQVVSVKTTKRILQQIEDDHENIEFVEVDDVIEATRKDVVPWGISFTQADSGLLVVSTQSGSSTAELGDCSNPNAFRVGLVDSGIYAGHPDLVCSGTDDPNCVGKSFGTEDPWQVDLNGHGTHVAGIISALGTDNKGVRGMVEDGNICLVISRVFGDSSPYTSLSSIIKGIRWAATKQNVKVINLSLTGGYYSVTSDRFFKRLLQKGIIVVAASGNAGTSLKSYPAAYDSVVSVGAIDENKNRAAFSQYNDMVDFAAPGVDIMSTAPLGMGTLTWLSVKSSPDRYYVKLLGNSPGLPADKSGDIVLCPNQGSSTCPGGGGQICLIENGGNSLDAKALNCQNGGGIAAVIYNNEDDGFYGSLSNNGQALIPVLSIDGVKGQTIVENYLNLPGKLGTDDGYISLDGTSMAAPHVTGAIAAIWRSCMSCTNLQVLSCLQSTALDLGDAGKDDSYGYGLIQASSAYDCLKSVCC